MNANSNYAIMSVIGTALMTLAVGMGGCTKYDMGTKFTTPQHVGQGLVVILPGIEGDPRRPPAGHAGPRLFRRCDAWP